MHGVDYKQCRCLPKAELKTKTNPNGHHPAAVWVRFGFQLDSLEKSDLVNVENFVGVLTISFVYVDSEQPLKVTNCRQSDQVFFLVNRVENQKLNQAIAELPFTWVFGSQLGLWQTRLTH